MTVKKQASEKFDNQQSEEIFLLQVPGKSQVLEAGQNIFLKRSSSEGLSSSEKQNGNMRHNTVENSDFKLSDTVRNSTEGADDEILRQQAFGRPSNTINESQNQKTQFLSSFLTHRT